MSDCSTAAMLPKEQPKTCGTCFYSIPRKYGHWVRNDLICLKHAVSTHSDRCCPAMPCGMYYSEPAGWMPKNSGTLEQRYQQLEQVALKMWQYIRDQTIEDETSEWTAQLKVLGVDVCD